MKVRYDSFEQYKNKFNHDDIPCIVYSKVKLTALECTYVANWHEDLEIQLFTSGEGYVLINGEKHAAKENDIVIINPNMVHYTGTDTAVTYYPLIIDSKFCKNAGIDCSLITFETLIKSEKAVSLFKKALDIYYDKNDAYQKARLQAAVLNLLIELCENHLVLESKTSNASNGSDSYAQIKNTIKFIRKHYSEKLTLDSLAKNVYMDKYTLSRKFKALTSLTIVEFLNNYRCEMAKGLIQQGVPVNQAAVQCGFNNMSFFTKTFKRLTGKLPSECKRKSHK